MNSEQYSVKHRSSVEWQSLPPSGGRKGGCKDTIHRVSSTTLVSNSLVSKSLVSNSLASNSLVSNSLVSKNPTFFTVKKAINTIPLIINKIKNQSFNHSPFKIEIFLFLSMFCLKKTLYFCTQKL